MCSTISIPIFPKIPKIILRKSSDQFGDLAQGHSAKNWEMLQLLRLIQWRLHLEAYFGTRPEGPPPLVSCESHAVDNKTAGATACTTSYRCYTRRNTF